MVTEYFHKVYHQHNIWTYFLRSCFLLDYVNDNLYANNNYVPQEFQENKVSLRQTYLS